MARSTFYYYLKHKNKDKYESEKQGIIEFCSSNKRRCSYKRISSLLKTEGYEINHKTVLKIIKTLMLYRKWSENGKYRNRQVDG